jgi:hypothetical protein
VRSGSAAREIVTAGYGVNWPSGRAAVVVRKQPSEAFAAVNGAFGVTELRIDELVADPLMVPFLETPRAS